MSVLTLTNSSNRVWFRAFIEIQVREAARKWGWLAPKTHLSLEIWTFLNRKMRRVYFNKKAIAIICFWETMRKASSMISTPRRNSMETTLTQIKRSSGKPKDNKRSGWQRPSGSKKIKGRQFKKLKMSLNTSVAFCTNSRNPSWFGGKTYTSC